LGLTASGVFQSLAPLHVVTFAWLTTVVQVHRQVDTHDEYVERAYNWVLGVKPSLGPRAKPPPEAENPLETRRVCISLGNDFWRKWGGHVHQPSPPRGDATAVVLLSFLIFSFAAVTHTAVTVMHQSCSKRNFCYINLHLKDGSGKEFEFTAC